jgi:hypothetical protein
VAGRSDGQPARHQAGAPPRKPVARSSPAALRCAAEERASWETGGVGGRSWRRS